MGGGIAPVVRWEVVTRSARVGMAMLTIQARDPMLLWAEGVLPEDCARRRG